MKGCVKSIIFISCIFVGVNYVCGMENNKMPEPVPGRTIIATFNIGKADVGKDVLIINDSQLNGQKTRTGIGRIYIYKLDEDLQTQPICIECDCGEVKVNKSRVFSTPGKYKICYYFKKDCMITDMSCMFNKCSSLISLDLSNFDAKYVKNMEFMCSLCNNLQSVEFGDNFNTNSVENMICMFYKCSSLTSLNLSSFNTDNVEYMAGMFYGCSSLKTLNLSKFNTNNVKNMSKMFYKCSSLTSLDLSNFKTDSVNSKSYLFEGCSSLGTVTTSDGFINERYKEIIDKNKKVKSEENEKKNLEDQNNPNINSQNILDVNQAISIVETGDNSQHPSNSNCWCCPC